jgi:hypothetical protein
MIFRIMDGFMYDGKFFFVYYYFHLKNMYKCSNSAPGYHITPAI